MPNCRPRAPLKWLPIRLHTEPRPDEASGLLKGTSTTSCLTDDGTPKLSSMFRVDDPELRDKHQVAVTMVAAEFEYLGAPRSGSLTNGRHHRFRTGNIESHHL